MPICEALEGLLPLLYLTECQAEDLIKVLIDLENSASSDAAVRERIAALPPEVSDVALLDKLTGLLTSICLQVKI